MTLVDLITSEAAAERKRLLVAASLAGIANSLVILFVNLAVHSDDSSGLRMFAMFVLAIVLFVLAARHTCHRTVHIIESALQRIKTRIVDKIERAELQGLERLGTAEIYDRITENVSVVSDAAGPIALCLQSLCILAFGTVYLAWLSLTAFVVVAAIATIGIIIYLSNRKEIKRCLREAAKTRVVFFDLLTDLLDGFKEAKFSRRRSRELRDDIVQTSDGLRLLTAKANILFNENAIFSTCLLFAVLGGLIFVLPRYIAVDATLLSQLVAGVIFVWGPLGLMLNTSQAYIRSNVALSQIEALEEKLDAATREAASSDAEDPWKGRFAALEASHVEYDYGPQNGGGGFRIGPLSLTVTAGEVVFIVGGNGSGKSTFMKVLTGLYPPSAGAVRVDGILVQPNNVAPYREMISAIYSDFHLFAKLYGLLGVEEASVHRLLAQMQLDGKTSFAKQRFTRRDLSTGQRKRLAMIVALLEDRPIYVFDEWAADQDPEFRKYFYEDLLPSLKRQGKTVIAVSHDDRYFRCADRVVTMESGKIRSIDRMATGPAQADAGPVA
ncbi:ABC transporter ATP-binding protein [Sorangium cellulosum]|uniref:ABC transporter ATP-binding protein n=1 Tax=Sorangium cellulosum TaxID=56 RepID=A0A2L0EW44_SORCE|nr:cyclic peptide export ABC transporter [Sorangium cellulosum]AUX43528.1 ABC transporter ATP-binding protein [Sorangium cellulosum]